MMLILLIFFLISFFGGIGLMAFGYRKNQKEGSKRYHPGNRMVNIGLIVIIASGLALAMVGAVGLNI